MGEDRHRWLVIGPDSATDLLEIIVLITASRPSCRPDRWPTLKFYRIPGGCSETPAGS